MQIRPSSSACFWYCSCKHSRNRISLPQSFCSIFRSETRDQVHCMWVPKLTSILHFGVDTWHQYKIELRVRNHTTIPRQTIIETVAQCVPEGHTVDLLEPQLFILVEVFKVRFASSPFCFCDRSIRRVFVAYHWSRITTGGINSTSWKSRIGILVLPRQEVEWFSKI